MAPMTEKSVQQAAPAMGVEQPLSEVKEVATATQPQPVKKSNNKGKLRKAVSLQDSPEAAAKALEAAGATPSKENGEVSF